MKQWHVLIYSWMFDSGHSASRNIEQKRKKNEVNLKLGDEKLFKDFDKDI